MKIAYVIEGTYPFLIGGGAKRCYEISNRLANKGHEIHIFQLRWWKKATEIKRKRIYYHGIADPIPLYRGQKRDIWAAIYYTKNLFRHLAKHNFDIIDCDQAPIIHCYPISLLSFLKQESTIFTWHEVWTATKYWSSYLHSMRYIGEIAEMLALRLPRKIIAASVKTKKDLLSIGINPSKISVVPNGVDLRRIEQIPPAEQEFDIVFAGRLNKTKNIDLLIYATAILSKHFPKIKVGIIGDGPERCLLTKLTVKLNIEKNVRFFGFLNYSKMISLLKSAKIFVHPSTQETGAPVVVLEAFSCGLPVIAVKHRNGISSEVIKEEYNGFFVERSASEIAKKISSLLENENLLKKMSKTAMNFSKKFDWENIVIKVERIYENIQS